MFTNLCRWSRASWLLLSLLSLATPAPAAVGHSEGADLVFGGIGTGPGQFQLLRDMVFDPQNNLWVLESNGPQRGYSGEMYSGVARIQKFDANGQFVSQFPLGDDIPAVRLGGPTRLAVNAAGVSAVILPSLGQVRLYDPTGTPLRTVPLPDCQAVAAWTSGGRPVFAVLTAKRTFTNRVWVQSGGEEIELLDPATGAMEPLKLSRPIREVKDMVAAPDGTLYALAEVRQIYQIDGTGKIVRVLGSGTTMAPTIATDGSEASDSVAVDSKANVYSVSGGNPANIIKYTFDGKTALLRKAQFKWADVWNGGPRVVLRVDHTDRLWAAATNIRDPKITPQFNFQPAIIRTEPDFLKAGKRGVKEVDARILGLHGSFTSNASLDVAYDLAPIKTEFVLAASNRALDRADLTLTAYDWHKNVVGTTRMALTLVNGQEARAPLSFTPPRFGWYTVRADLASDNQILATYGHHFLVTPPYHDLPQLKADETTGTWEDPARQMFVGLPNQRLHFAGIVPEQIPKNLAALVKNVAAATASKTTFFVQLSQAKAELNVDRIRPALEALKGKVKYVELCNEPNFLFKPEEYVAAATPVYRAVKEVDPTIQVLGPAVCGMQLAWHEAFFKAGGAATFDIFSTHDYEGNESITPDHWIWKMGAMREMLARYGVADKPFWQTERAVSALRGAGLQGVQQAVRISLRYDLMESLGVPTEHNNHYYLNEGGYSSIPSYIWSRLDGPFPAVAVMRTRYALIQGRTYRSKLDFGSGGNQLLFGLRYGPPANGNRDQTGDGLLLVRNVGERPLPWKFLVHGGNSLQVMDAWGNAANYPVTNGQVELTVDQLPQYIVQAAGQTVEPASVDFGRDLALSAQVTYLGQSASDATLLNNGVVETYHLENPSGGSLGGKIWRGEAVTPDTPRTLELRWANPRTFDSVLLSSPRADNLFCALLDFDVQIPEGDGWKTVARVRTDLPETYAADMGDAIAVQFQEDDNLRLARFATVTADRLRIVALRTTYGFDGDAAAHTIVRRLLSNPPPPLLMVREIEVYGPPSTVQVTARGVADERAGRGDTEKMQVSVSAARPSDGALEARAPAGWIVTPNQLNLTAKPGGAATAEFSLTPPQNLTPGKYLVDFAWRDADGKIAGADAASVTYGAPLALTPLPPPVAAQTISLKVENTGPGPATGTATLHLTNAAGGPAFPDVTLPLPALDPRQIRNVNFEVPGLHLANSRWMATYTVKVNGLVQTATQDLRARTWLVAGPFENDFDKEFGPENGVDPAHGFTDMMGNEFKWRPVTTDAIGFLDFARAFDKKDNALAYAAVWVKATTATRAVVLSGSDDGGRVWLNGKEIISQNTTRAARPDSDETAVDLKAGWNLVLAKVTQSSGDWGFYFDIVDQATRKPLPGLTYAASPPP